MIERAPGICPLCGAASDCAAFPYATRWQGVEYRYLNCGGCGAAFVSPTPSERTLLETYEWEAYHQRHYGIPVAERASDERMLTALAQAGYGAGRILDFGCGSGDFLLAARRRGYDGAGVEYAPSAIRGARARTELPVTSLREALTSRERFDVVHLNDVLAHLPHPDELLASLCGLLSPDGVFAIGGGLERNHSVVYGAAVAAKLVRRQLRLEGDPPEAPPTMLVRTDARSQRSFFLRIGWRELHFELYETGWPYLTANGDAPRGPRSALRTTIGAAAVAVAETLPSLRLGNRFLAIERPGPRR